MITQDANVTKNNLENNQKVNADCSIIQIYFKYILKVPLLPSYFHEHQISIKYLPDQMLWPKHPELPEHIEEILLMKLSLQNIGNDKENDIGNNGSRVCVFFY